MTIGPTSQCSTCARFRSPFDRPDMSGPTSCEAFPDGIPEPVFFNGFDHRQPIEGDHGVRWESNGEPYPEWALAVPTRAT